MRLRTRLLLLVALLLLGVLGGTFAWLASDLRRQFRSDLEASLGAAASSFRAGEAQRFRTLEVMAGSLEASPSFRNVLRQTDRATLLDFTTATAQGLQVSLVLVSDAEGQILARSGKSSGLKEHPEAALLRAWAGQTATLREYWWLDGTLYQTATVPLADSQGYIDGYVSVGYTIDRALLGQLAEELSCRLEIAQVGSSDGETASEFQSVDSLWRRLPLLGDPTEAAQAAAAQLMMARSLAPIEAFVADSQRKLLILGGVAFLLAMALGYPMVGRLANPVEALERAEAEMAAIFRSSLDGLVSLDEHGLVSMANPAAEVALGRTQEGLLGCPLGELLPSDVLGRLLAAPVGAHQQADFQREGRRFEIHRTFLRQDSRAELGSILLFRDRTDSQEREHRVSAFLRHLSRRFAGPDTAAEVRVALSTLLAWAALEDSPSQGSAVQDLEEELRRWVDEFRAHLADERPCQLQIEPLRGVGLDMTAEALRQIVDALLWNSREHGQGTIRVGLRRLGGCLEISVADEGSTEFSELGDCLHGPGLGLKLAKVLSERAQGRLELTSGSAGTRFALLVPRQGPSEPC